MILHISSIKLASSAGESIIQAWLPQFPQIPQFPQFPSNNNQCPTPAAIWPKSKKNRKSTDGPGL